MTDYGLPIVDGAPACPFVALEEDRDERATSPDHRHRCYAELHPAPRALAHQSAYCLSSAFAACPTFQDWARREAARPRAAPAIAGLPAEAPRNPPRDWSDPPPWKGGTGDFGGAGAGSVAASAGSAAATAGAGSAAAASAGSAGAHAGGPLGDVAGAGSAASGFPAGRSRPDQGLAESTALRIASGRTDDAAWRGDVPERDQDSGEGSVDSAPYAGRAAVPARAANDARPRVGETPARPVEAEVVGPAWERPRRFEEYPALKTRVGLPNVPRIAVMAAAIVVAAIVLFFLPALLGIGQQNAGITSSGSPAGSAAASASPVVTPVPAPTQLTYVVAPNDTMSKIAARFHVALADLIAANKAKYPNPNKIAIGDVLVIPTAQPSTLNAASSSP